MLSIERKRAERSRRQFVLMLLDAVGVPSREKRAEVLQRVIRAIVSSTRQSDVKGWYNSDAIVGVILTEIATTEINQAVDVVHSKVSAALRVQLSVRQVNDIHISFHVFPEDGDPRDNEPSADSRLYPDLRASRAADHISRGLKRVMDIGGSLAALLVLSPLFAIIAAAIRVTSKGPILYRQTRVGQRGVRFTFLKFRSMYNANDPRTHEEYVKKFIAGEADGGEGAVYKMRDDPRITPLGRLIRQASLDELPQFLNVLKGEMSLVGPRPAIPYEIEAYDRWHRARLLEAKPGITGLWQVSARSKTKFDDMVRLDLRYARDWSLWLDLKILMRTPKAVLSGEGAY
jgi:lipopolysaccharide/colanic/teichoic acid biosynthesis glycosyltransferase